MLWLNGASMIALTTSGDESASPMPSRPVSVRTRTSTASWLLAVLASTFWMRRIWQTISVIFIRGSELAVCGIGCWPGPGIIGSPQWAKGCL